MNRHLRAARGCWCASHLTVAAYRKACWWRSRCHGAGVRPGSTADSNGSGVRLIHRGCRRPSDDKVAGRSVDGDAHRSGHRLRR